jgi:hypothetical protein
MYRAGAIMRALPFVVTFALVGILLSGALALAQTQAADAPPTPPPTLPPVPARDAGSHGETQLEAEPVVVEGTIQGTGPKAPAAPPAARAPGTPPSPAPPSPRATLAPYEKAYVHKGLYVGLTSSIGGLGVWGNGPTGSASISGFATGQSLAIGGSPVPGLAIAGVLGWTTTAGDTFHGGPMVSVMTTGAVQTPVTTLKGNASAATFLFGVLADWFPLPTGGWHVGGALGLGGATVTDDAHNMIGGSSVAGSVFGGYQWWLGPSWSLGISAFVTIAPSVDMSDWNGNDTGYHMMPLSAGLQGRLLYY